jgi:hypothetical protein
MFCRDFCNPSFQKEETMSEWKKLALTWAVSILIGFYSVFVIMEKWNWFAVPLLHVSEASYWLMYGVSLLFGLMTGANGEQENPVHERRWKASFIALDACVPEHKAEVVREEVRSETEGVWTDIGMVIFGKVVSRSLTLGLGFVVHLLI